MTADEALACCLEAVAAIGDDAEVTVTCDDEACLRFAGNEPIEHTAATVTRARLRLRADGRYGEAVTERLDPVGLRRLADDARRQLNRLPAESEPLGSAGPQAIAPVAAWFPDSAPATFDAEARVAAAAALVRTAVEQGLSAAGIVQVSGGVRAMATSRGLRAAHAATAVQLSVTVQADDGSGSRSAWSRDGSTLDPDRLGVEAVETALRARSPRPLDPGVYRAVLAADAVAPLLGFLAGGFNARQVSDRQSWLTDRLGEAVTGPRIELAQAPDHPALLGPPFDGDGMAVRPVTLLRGGVATGLTHDRRTAAEAGAEPTGYSAGGRLTDGASPVAVTLAGGEAGLDDLLAACGDGLYVSRLWYCNWLDPRVASVTGMTRDGVFRVRDGRLAEPVTNLRFGQSVPELLAGVEALGTPVIRAGVAAPALAVAACAFTSATLF